MGLMTKMGTGQGYLKAGFQGFNKAGKTYTAALLATGTREFLGLKGPIAFFDTEGGAEYVAPMIRKATGMDPVGIRSRAIDDLLTVGNECVAEGVSVLLVDSISHAWAECMDSYLKKVNEVRSAKNLPARTTMEFQDWGPVKQKFARWTDFYLNSPLHIIVCGRAQHIYDFETNEETGKKTLIKTGVKMRSESEFGFEPSLLVEMERVQDLTSEKRLTHRATIIGDRFNVIDGKTMENPDFDFFKPYLECLKPGVHAPVDTAVKSDPGVNGEGDSALYAERRQRTVACEKIAAELDKVWSGTSGAAKKGRADALDKAFGTRSWTEIEGMRIDRLREGFTKIREMVNNAAAEEVK